MNAKLKMFLFKFRYVLILLIVMAALTIATPRFFSANNFLNILWSVSVVGIISMGATFVILNGNVCPGIHSGSSGSRCALRNVQRIFCCLS